MNKIKYAVFTFILSSTILFSQSTVLRPFTVNELKTSAIGTDLRNAVDDAKIIDVDFNTVHSILNTKADKITVSFPLDGRFYELAMERFDILAPDVKVVGGTLSGDRNITGSLNFVTYTTPIHDKNIPLIVFTLSQNEISIIAIADGETFVLAKQDSRNPASDYILFRASKVKLHSDFKCGTESLEIPEQIKQMMKDIQPGGKDYSTAEIRTANIAIESDYETFQYYGGTLNATNYIMRLMSPVSAIYVRDMNIKLQVTYLRVWEDVNDPYPDATSSNTLLNAFRNYWNANMNGINRTIAHFISTRPGGLGGIAWVNVLCANFNTGYGYAFSDIDGTFNPIPAYSWDVMVVAHETGHNFGSPHTHNCGWSGGPIDSCYQVEGGCYSGPAIPRVGTIMSYCHLNGSISLAQGFGPQPSQLIRMNAESAPCLTSTNGYLVAMPNGGEIFRVGNNTLIVWGSSLTGNINIEFTTNNGTNWQTIQNNVDVSLRNINWTIPSINATTTQARVRIYQSGNPGNSDQSDSVFQIRPNIQPFTLVSPPLFHRVYTSPTDTGRINFIFTKAGPFPELRYKWFLNNFSNTLSYNQLTNNSGIDSIASVRISKIDSIIAGWGINTGDSLRGRWFVRAYTQFDSTGPTNSNLIITFIRSPIGIQPVSTVIPAEYFVDPNYPNPFNPVTNIKFGLPKQSFVKFTVYDILGRETAVLVNEKLDAGEYKVDWNAENMPSGVYFYRIEAGSFTKTAKMILVK